MFIPTQNPATSEALQHITPASLELSSPFSHLLICRTISAKRQIYPQARLPSPSPPTSERSLSTGFFAPRSPINTAKTSTPSTSFPILRSSRSVLQSLRNGFPGMQPSFSLPPSPQIFVPICSVAMHVSRKADGDRTCGLNAGHGIPHFVKITLLTLPRLM